MMKRIIRNIQVFSVSLAAIVFIVHMIIPHDHHTSDSDILQEKKCPVSDKEEGHHSGFPVHCHAFNCLASEKTVNYVTEHVQCMDYIDVSIFNSLISDIQFFGNGSFDIVKHPLKPGIPELSSLRAPPKLD